MAKYKGCLGSAKAGATPSAVINITNWNFTVNRTPLDATAMDGTCNSSTILGTKKTTGSFTYWLDHDDTGQIALDSDSAVTIELYNEGETSGDNYWTGSVLVTSWGVDVPVEGIQSGTASWEVDGELTKSTVV